MGNDALSAYDYIHAHKPGEPIILYGMSMGTGVSSYVAARRSVAAMILDSPFISPERTAKDWFSILNLYPTQMFPEPRYDNGDFLAGKHPPALIIVKGCDAICWPTQGTELASRAIPPTTTMILPNSQHLYVDTRDEAAYDKGTSQFLDGVEKLNVLVTR
jgi:acetyl esterase/lipase